MLVSAAGRSKEIDVSPAKLKAPSPIDVTEEGMVMEVSPEQELNALLGISEAVTGTVKEVPVQVHPVVRKPGSPAQLDGHAIGAEGDAGAEGDGGAKGDGGAEGGVDGGTGGDEGGPCGAAGKTRRR